jgi:hypothetical protein
MADKKTDAGAEGGDAKAAKKGGLKFALVTVALLAVEAAVLVGVFSMAGPKTTQASIDLPPVDERDALPSVELPVLDDRLVNDRTGIAYLYRAEVFVKVGGRFAEDAAKYVEANKNDIRAEIAGIWRTAEPHHFQEPTHDTLARRIESALRGRMQELAGDQSRQVVEKCILIVGTGVRVNR